jgi:hypothetical protein
MSAFRTALFATTTLALAGCPYPPVYSIKRDVASAPNISCAREAISSMNGVVGVVVNHTGSGYYVLFETAHGLQNVSITSSPKSTVIQSIGTNSAGDSAQVLAVRRAEAEAAVAVVQQRCTAG